MVIKAVIMAIKAIIIAAKKRLMNATIIVTILLTESNELKISKSLLTLALTLIKSTKTINTN
jgi:hypothetical protein